MKSPFEKKSESKPGLDGVKNIIAIASGKGGVGKSTVASNLAVALKETGATVGLLDADIYGPSQPGMLGSKNRQPEVGDGVLYPVENHGIGFVSMGLLTDDDSPVIWRAPIAMKMIHQFLNAVVWGELDYLLIDLPPGTGDVQLTLAQQAQLTGAIIVTTPQEVALGVARKGLRMFEQVKVPIIGVVENMSGFTCKHCNKETAIFDKGGGERMAKAVGTAYLGSLPLDPEIMMSGDKGIPILNNGHDSAAAKAILAITAKVQERLAQVREELGERPTDLLASADGHLQVVWPDGIRNEIEAYHLRVSCPCASCVDEDTGKRTLNPALVPLDIKIRGVNRIGNYGMAVEFSDGHNTGIYSYVWLKSEASVKDNKSDQSFSV